MKMQISLFDLSSKKRQNKDLILLYQWKEVEKKETKRRVFIWTDFDKAYHYLKKNNSILQIEIMEQQKTVPFFIYESVFSSILNQVYQFCIQRNTSKSYRNKCSQKYTEEYEKMEKRQRKKEKEV